MSWIATAIALTATSAVVGAAGSIYAGKSARIAGEYNAKVDENQAKTEELEAAEEARRKRIENKEILGNQLARRAAAGVDLQSGSSLLVAAETAGRLELDIFENNRQSQNTAMRYRSSATMSRFEGAQANKASKFKAGESLLRGAGQIASIGMTI